MSIMDRHLGRTATALILAMTVTFIAGRVARAQNATSVRIGDHPGFGRVVFDLPEAAEFNLVNEGERVLLAFRGAGLVPQPMSLPRNVLSVQAGQDTATLLLVPGAQTRAVRMGNRLVIDILPPSSRLGLAQAASSTTLKTALPAVRQIARPVGPLRPVASRWRGAFMAAPAVPVPATPARGGHADEQPVAGALTPPPSASSAAVPSSLAAAPAADAVPSAEGHGPGNLAEVTAPLRLAADAPSPALAAGPHASAGVKPVPAPHAEETPDPKEHAAGPTESEIAQGAPIVPVAQNPLPPPHEAGPGEVEVSATKVAAPLLLRADRDVGAAAFRRGAFGVIVLDRRLSPAALPEGASWVPGAVSSTIQLPLAEDAYLRLTRLPAGWSVETGASKPDATLSPAPVQDGTALPLARPGRVVTLVDPLTEGALLIGTSLASGPEAALALARQTPDFTLLPSWVGVVVAPTSDRVDLRSTPKGFVLAGSPVRAIGPGDTMSRRFELPNQPPAALLNRLQAQLAGAAGAQPRARTRDRVGAAQSMIALGMGAEAQSLLQLVAAEDPQAASDAEVVGLQAIAALLAGRPGEAEGVNDPRLDGTDEMAMWRGVRDRRLGRDTEAARRVGEAAALASTYAPSLRRLIMPDIAESAVEAGAPLSANDLTPYAKALALERDGKVDEALAAYGVLADGADRLDQVRATARATELRLASGRISPKDASSVLEGQAFAWRGDAREVGLRLRSAELRGVAGEWRPALDMLRAIEAAHPEQHAAVQTRKAAVLQAMVESEGRGTSPLDLVLLAAEYVDAVPEGEQGGALARMLAEKLMALDLPARAIPVLQGLVRAAPAGEPRAEFGARLSQLLLDGGDPAGAATALSASAAPDLPLALRETRGLIQARVLAGQGDVPGAADALFALGTEAADDQRATMLAGVGDWRGSLSALSDLAAKRVPAVGALSDAAQDVLLRQASAAAQIPDPAMLQTLERSASRMTGSRADLFRVLTAAPVVSATDLPRAARELVLARAVPQQVQSLGSR